MENLIWWKEYASLVYKIHKPKPSFKKEIERKVIYERLKEHDITKKFNHKIEFTTLMNDIYLGWGKGAI